MFSLPDLLPNPTLILYDGANQVIGTNDNWNPTTTPAGLFANLGAFGLPSGSADAALQITLAPGNYSAVLADSASRTGTGLVEIYEADNNTTRIINLSSRAFVGPDVAIGIAGIVVRGEQPGRYLIRGIGPSLSQFGVGGVLADPLLTLTTSAGTVVSSNDNWGMNDSRAEIVATSTRVGAFPLDPASKDAVLLLTLAPGNYTALVSGAGNTTGVALVEVYEVP